MITTSKGRITIRRVWRSQLKRMVIYFILCAASVSLSRYFPGSIISGKLFDIGPYRIILHFPLYSLFPLAAMGNLIVPIYDAVFTMDGQGLEMIDGILSLNQRIVRVRFEDVRSIELDQTLLDRILNVGNIGVASAATGSMEIIMDGIGSPRELQSMIQSERDRRIKVQRKTAPVEAALGD